MGTPVANFAECEVSTGYGAGDTSIVVATGQGSRFPSTYPYPLAWWNYTDYPNPADDPNREIVSVTARSTDTFTITRAQEGTSASAKNTADKTYRVCLGITKAMWDAGVAAGESHSGLILETHPSADLALSHVQLTGVDYIIMDDGTFLGNSAGEWIGKLADVTSSGAGGLDTGTEGAGVVYDIYAIAKEDGTRNLLLHKAKIAAIDATHITQDATQGIRSDVDNSTVKVAQGFQLSNSGRIPYVDLYLIKVGSPTGYLYVTLETDSGGVPSGTPLAISHLIDVSRLDTSARAVRIPMEITTTFSSGTQYHIVAQGDWTVSASDYVGWRMDGSAATYADGSKALWDSDTSTWTTDTDDDLSFNVYIELFDTSVTMPSGYTKKCHLGYVLNYGGGSFNNFIPFIQLGRSMKFLQASAIFIQNETVAGPNLYDIGTLIPVRNNGVRIHVALTGTSAAVATYALGDWRSTDLSSSTGVGAQLILYAPLTAEIPCAFGSMHVTNGCVIGQGTTSADLHLTGFDW